jgi:hypothetical protein
MKSFSVAYFTAFSQQLDYITFGDRVISEWRTNIHALSGIQTHGLSAQAIKAYASDRAVTGAGSIELINLVIILWNTGSENANKIGYDLIELW